MKTVSIIIPCYNCEAAISEAIESALDQSYPNCEVIVVDDGSTDNSFVQIQKFENRIVYIKTENRGASAARNNGLRHANGEWVQFLDGDDVMAHEKIETQIRLADIHGPRALFTSSWGRFSQEIGEAELIREPVSGASAPLDWLSDKYMSGKMTPIHSWLVSKMLIGETGGWNESISRNDDGEFFDRMVLRASVIVHCPETAVYYRSGSPLSLSQQYSEAAFESVLSSLRGGVGRLLEMDDTVEKRAACSAMLMRLAYYAYPNFPDLAHRSETLANSISDYTPQLPGGQVIEQISKRVSWRFARILQYYSRRIRRTKDPVIV